MQNLLHQLLAPGVTFVGLIDLDGYCLSSVSQPVLQRKPPRAEDVAVLVSALCAASRAAGRLFTGEAAPRKVQFESFGGVLLISWTGRRHALVAHALSPAIAPALDQNMARLEPELCAALAGGPASSPMFQLGDDIEIADLGSIRFD